MSAELLVLGAGSILPRVGYGCSGYALRPSAGSPVTLIDCGPGSIRALAAGGVRLDEVRRVVLSHYHLDHCLDLFALFFARRNPGLRDLPCLELVGPPGLRRLVERAPDAMGRWAVDPDCTVHEVEIGTDGRGRCTTRELRLECARTGHTETAVAWRIELPDGTSLVYTGDTGEVGELVELARGADVLLSECSFLDGRGREHHLTPSGAARLARAAGVGRLILTHFYPETDPEEARRAASHIFGRAIEIARDGTVHSLGPERIMGG